MEPIPYEVEAGPYGPEKVQLGDTDITDAVHGFSLVSQNGAPPVLHLGLKPGEQTEPITGLGAVVVQPAGGDVVAFLANVDREALETETMTRGGRPLLDVVDVLMEWAKAAGA